MEIETIKYISRNQTRANAMQQDAHTFANGLIGIKTTDAMDGDN